MKAAIYLRISQDATGEQAGVTRQREDCLELVKSQGWEVFDTYQDNDFSASAGKKRPEYNRMLEDIRNGLVDAVVAWHPDRLYRKLPDLEELINAVEARNVIMRTHRAGEIDLATPTGRMLARILSATAQAEGEVKADRWRRSWRQGREAGNFPATGNRMFGYTRDGQILPHEAQIAREMIAGLLAGESLDSVSRTLDDAGILTTRGLPWRIGTIRQYIRNPRIAGWSTLKGEIVGEGKWEPIIDLKTWGELEALTGARTSRRPTRVALLNGLIHCSECGTRLVTGNYGKGRRAYRCPKRIGEGYTGCGSLSGMAEPIEEIVEAYARQRLADPRVLQRLAELQAEPAAKHAEIADLSLRITELEAELDKPGTPVAAILRAIDRARERREALMRDTSASTVVPPAADTEWPTELRRRRALIDLVIAHVELAPANRSRGARLGFDNNRVHITAR